MTSPALRRAAVAAVTLPFLALSACDNAKERAALLEQEAQALRDRNAQLEAANREAESQRLLLEEELNRLRGQAGPQNGSTGFEGISGVNSAALPGGGAILDIVGDVLFDSGRTTIKQTAKRTLNDVAQVINSRYPSNTIRIEGHTDADPIRKSNWKTNERLGAERALAVEEYLSSRGVDNNRMYIASFGPSHPKSSKSASRRVEIIILGN
ncbi:MAG: flagellar motor protein MotB [Phycisphaerales bacterium]